MVYLNYTRKMSMDTCTKTSISTLKLNASAPQMLNLSWYDRGAA